MRSHIGHRPAAATDGATARITQAWWRQPVAWLGAAIFAASLAGCIVMIVLAERNKDEALPTAGNHVLSVPLARSAAADADGASRR